ncbi:MAG TPA: PilZ domain-containing protein [Bryobacteraceae bacterium]|jgi:c-di-GMP-binding flagellar brake protein YcgR|nr:PilZ domain-containing protein [Bryobacteraceae bacterium]
MDRRTRSRIDVQLTCFVGSDKAHAEPLRAFTENVSRTGVLMRWIEGTPLPDIERKLVLEVKLPENSEVGPRVMRCRTEVIRITPTGKTHAVALRILSMRFVKDKRSRQVNDLASMPVPVDRII